MSKPRQRTARASSVILPALGSQARGSRVHRCSLVEESSSARLGEEEAPQAALSKQSQREHVASSVRNYKQQLAAQHRQHATGVSYLTDVPGRAEPVPAAQGSTHFAKFADAHLPPGGSSHAPSHTGRGPDPFTSGAEDRAWSLGTFEKKVPSGRQDVLELQLWLRDQMLALKSTSQGTGDQSADLFAYAEKTLDLYNMAFHELTRQVAVNCVERGRLLADVWTSQSELVSQILMDLKAKKDAHEAMSIALHKRSAIVDDACVQLRDKVLLQMQEIKELKDELRKKDFSLQEMNAREMGVSPVVLAGNRTL